MSYWRDVALQAGREALGELRWTGPLKVAQSVVPTLASGAATWAATGQPAWGAGASLLALIAVGAFWFFQRLVVIPPALDAALQKQVEVLKPKPDAGLKGGFTLKPDIPLAAAIKFAATGSWSGELGDLSFDGYLVALDKAITDFTTLAAGNQIRVFHRGYKDAPHETLTANSWFSHRIDVTDILDGEAFIRRRKDGTRVETCHDLRVSREQWDANWDYLRGTVT